MQTRSLINVQPEVAEEATPLLREQAPRRFVARHGLPLMVGSFIVITSFCYGLTRGLQHRPAFATSDLFSSLSSSDLGLKRLEIPSGATPIPLGTDVEINGQAAEMLSFTSDRSPQTLTDEQLSRWRERGFEVAGKSTVRRGIAFALDRASGDRYSFSAWSVPGPFQAIASQGRPVQGLMSVVDKNDRTTGAAQSVPDVPIMSEGKGGAVISSVDRGLRSYSSAYTNPGSLEENLSFYRTELASRGWRERFSDLQDGAGVAAHQSGSASFVRGEEEVTLLFSPLRDEDQQGERTVVAVTRAGRTDRLEGPRRVQALPTQGAK